MEVIKRGAADKEISYRVACKICGGEVSFLGSEGFLSETAGGVHLVFSCPFCNNPICVNR